MIRIRLPRGVWITTTTSSGSRPRSPTGNWTTCWRSHPKRIRCDRRHHGRALSELQLLKQRVRLDLADLKAVARLLLQLSLALLLPGYVFVLALIALRSARQAL